MNKFQFLALFTVSALSANLNTFSAAPASLQSAAGSPMSVSDERMGNASPLSSHNKGRVLANWKKFKKAVCNKLLKQQPVYVTIHKQNKCDTPCAKTSDEFRYRVSVFDPKNSLLRCVLPYSSDSIIEVAKKEHDVLWKECFPPLLTHKYAQFLVIQGCAIHCFNNSKQEDE